MWPVVQRLLRRPVYAVSVMLVLGIGLGGAYCLYGIADAVLFRPLEIAAADRVVRVFKTDESGTRDNWSREDILQQLATVEAFGTIAFYALYALGIGGVLLAALLVSAAPAWRAARVQPMAALRYE